MRDAERRLEGRGVAMVLLEPNEVTFLVSSSREDMLVRLQTPGWSELTSPRQISGLVVWLMEEGQRRGRKGKTKADRRYLEVGGHGSGKEVIMYSQLEKAVCRTK
jgi:hypothetical protein